MHYAGNVSRGDHIALFDAIGHNGALPHLECLHLLGASPRQQGPPQQYAIPANSLPSLRALRLDAPKAPPALIAALLAAAGPHLALITTRADSRVSDAVVGLLATHHGYPWLLHLRELRLDWFSDPTWDAPGLLAALARLPALEAVVLRGPAYDEVAVRLLGLLEAGRLPALKSVKFAQSPYQVADPSFALSDGVRLLLALWSKRQRARKGQVVVWDVEELRSPTWAAEKVVECIAQPK